VLVAAAGVGDGGENKLNVHAVEAGEVTAEVDGMPVEE